MRYLTYEEYLSIGGALENIAFERVTDRACGIIDLYTHNRLRNVFGASEMVKACVRDLCEYFYNNGMTSGATITSRTQSAGGVSESESYATRTTDEADADVKRIIYDYLASEEADSGTPLLYRGCNS